MPPPAPQAATISEHASATGSESTGKTRDMTEVDDEGEPEFDTETHDTVGSKRRGIRLKQDLN